MNCQAWWCNRLVVKPPGKISGTWSSLFDRDWMSLSFWGPWAWAEIQSPCRFHVVKACDRAAFCRGHTSHHNTGDVEMSDSSIQHSTLVAGHHSCKLAYKANEYYSCFHYHKSNSETGDICPDLAIVNGGPTLDDLVCQHWSALTMGPWGHSIHQQIGHYAKHILHSRYFEKWQIQVTPPNSFGWCNVCVYHVCWFRNPSKPMLFKMSTDNIKFYCCWLKHNA